MAEIIHTYDGRAWEIRIQKLLKMRYDLGEYQEIPDKHVGDFGLEGFSRDGCAFQCYAAEEPIGTNDLYEKQRNKIAQDIKKFIANQAKLETVLDEIKIHRWLLVVPRFDSAQLLAYATSKAGEVRQAGLPYVADDFQIGVVTDENFAPEIQALAKVGGIQLNLPLARLDSSEMDNWTKNNSPLISTMESKIRKMRTLSSQELRSKLRDEMVRHFLIGQNALGRLKKTYPELYEEVVKLKDEKESFLLTESLLSTDPPNKTLTETIKGLSCMIQDQLPGVTSQTAKVFAFEAASDWLLRCPLDFPVNP